MQEEAEAQVAEADAKLGELSQEVQQYRDLNERYHQISEENRHLYNTVQDLRGNIRVFCRVRPRGRTGDASASMVEVRARAAKTQGCLHSVALCSSSCGRSACPATDHAH